jgi:hypothetical protein
MVVLSSLLLPAPHGAQRGEGELVGELRKDVPSAQSKGERNRTPSLPSNNRLHLFPSGGAGMRCLLVGTG